jgi:hypothetical protein
MQKTDLTEQMGVFRLNFEIQQNLERRR